MRPDAAAPPRHWRADSLDRILMRVSNAPLRAGNQLTLLQNGRATYDDWLAAIAGATRWIHLENYIFRAHGIGRAFADALLERAAAGVRVRVIYDWWGSLTVPYAFWRELRRGGIEVRQVHPPNPLAPLALFARDHSKLLAVDGTYASLGGVGIDDQWLAHSPVTGLPYRDTAVRVAGPAVADLERAFARVWRQLGPPLPPDEHPHPAINRATGDVAVRVVAQEPGRMRMLRTLELVAAGVERRLWIADAYFLGVPLLDEALMAAARDGVDVRLLLPATNDLRIVGALSRYGYRPLLEAGVRIWEYAGLMMHAKTLVADGWLGRIGSTNMNVTGLLTNWEIDLIAQNRAFGALLEAMYEDDLAHAREIRLVQRRRRQEVRPVRPESRAERRARREMPGKPTRARATALRVGGAALQAASGDQVRRHERVVGSALGATALGAAVVAARFPRLIAWPLAAISALGGALGLLRSLRQPARKAAGRRRRRATRRA